MARYTTPDGTPIPSVTEILDNIGWKTWGLKIWAYNQGRAGKDMKATLKGLADAGSLTHAMVDATIKGKPLPSLDGLAPEIVERGQQGFDAFRNWRKTSRFELVASEVMLVSEGLGYAGQIDCVAHVEGAVAIVDWKSSKATYPDQIVQIAAYAALWNDAHPDLPVQALRVVRFPPEGGFADQGVSRKQWDAADQSFAAAFVLHRMKKLLKAA